VSSSPGIEQPAERARRREADAKLAERLEREPFESFIERWSRQPLFAEDPPNVLALALEDQRRNDPRSLAVALRRLGTGQMLPLWERLGGLPMPVTLLVGERDVKFYAVAERMHKRLTHGRLSVLAGGHRLPLENPRGIAQALADPGCRPAGSGSRRLG
jgi:2-succinyl-6-hydroxy-2,4-cyclohexadiene-1-carboxylate synthase